MDYSLMVIKSKIPSIDELKSGITKGIRLTVDEKGQKQIVYQEFTESHHGRPSVDPSNLNHFLSQPNLVKAETGSRRQSVIDHDEEVFMFEENSDNENEEDFEKQFKNIAQFSDKNLMKDEFESLIRKQETGEVLSNMDKTRLQYLEHQLIQDKAINEIRY